MADLVVKAPSESKLRRVLDGSLSVTFPIWGIISPVLAFACLLQIFTFLRQANTAKATELLAYFVLCTTFTLLCLLTKRALSNDYMIVDRQGVKLPRLLGARLNLNSYVAWKDIQRLSAIRNERQWILVISINNRRPLSLPTRSFEPGYVEQFLLAAKLWAPSVCDQSLDEVQNTLRDQAPESNSSYTALWNEELARRFNPTAYIALEPGKVLRNSTLKIVSHLASGGLSALYLCQMDGKKLVVLKEAVIPDDGPENIKEKARELFDREASLLMKLDHANIVHVLDSFSEQGRNYLVLEYANGTDLRQLVAQSGPQRESDVLDWALQIAHALKYLHERDQPIIHRDLTPDNIVLRNDGQIVIVDFGAANEFIGTATGTFVGKHAFVAPEQFRGKAVVQSDIYAFGCTLFFLLTAEEPEALSPSNPHDKCPAASAELCELIESCTRLEAGDRYQSMAQLIPVLRRLAAQTAGV